MTGDNQPSQGRGYGDDVNRPVRNLTGHRSNVRRGLATGALRPRRPSGALCRIPSRRQSPRSR
eukprot:11207827-Lingulodinium_polyedra.AAC.1